MREHDLCGYGDGVLWGGWEVSKGEVGGLVEEGEVGTEESGDGFKV